MSACLAVGGAGAYVGGGLAGGTCVASGGAAVVSPGCAAGGAVVGGALGCGAGIVATEVIHYYAEGISHALNSVFSESSEDSADPEIKLPSPGQPAQEDGYDAPKPSKYPKDADKHGRVKNPNGQGKGWPAKDGGVWVPTGGKAEHGGEHWDVQYPNGKHKNIYPGGKER